MIEQTNKGDLGHMITVAEAARLLKRSRSRVQQFIDEGRIPARRVGDFMQVVDERDVLAFSKIPRKPGRKPKKAG